MDEQWKSVPRYPDYCVSNHGRVLSLKHGKRRILKLSLGGGKEKRYLVFCVSSDIRHNNGDLKRIRLYVHHLVAELFIGPRPPGMLVLHRDDNHFHNHVENLYYGTHSNNAKDSVRNFWRNIIFPPTRPTQLP